MGATSVTGTGLGSADGFNKGSEHMTLGVNHLIGPHIVAAGVETLSGTTAVIEIPPQTGVNTDYGVLLTNNSSTNAFHTGLQSNWTFTVTAGSGNIVWWAVVKNGL